MNNLGTTLHERRYNVRDAKRPRLRLTTEQDSTSPSCVLDALMFRIRGLEKNLELYQLDAASSSSSHRVPVLDDSIQNVERPTDSSTIRLSTPPGYYSPGYNRDLGFDEPSRGRTPQRTEHTHHSPGTRPVSRAGSASSARSMIDERLEWAHQDRMRSASRDRSAPPSPFHENSPFYAEFARHTGHASTSNEDKSFGITAAELPHGPQAQSSKCSQISPFIGRPCNTTFSRKYDLKRHEDDIHGSGQRRHRCPHCRERKFTRKQQLTRHLRIMHPETSTHHWSCAALANPEDAMCHVHQRLSICAYCGMELQGSLSDRRFHQHLLNAHRFRTCDTEMMYFRPEHFRQHLEESHGASSSGEWINILSNRCFGNDHLFPGTMVTDVHASRAFTPEFSKAGLEEPSPRSSNSPGGEDQTPAPSRYMCECCPKEPKTFDTEEDLRYAVHFTLVRKIWSIVANRSQDPRVHEAIHLQ